MINFITFRSLNNRKFTTTLCVLSIALSVFLFLGIERLRVGARDGFTNTISQTDLIVGAKGGELNLLLYTIFHIGSAVNNIRFASYEKIKSDPRIEWAIPISLGDNYKGSRVVATDGSFYKHYHFRGDQNIKFDSGSATKDVFDVVIGSSVAIKHQLKVGDPIILAHGVQGGDILKHERTPFKIVGILAMTQTPIDKAVYITLYGMEALHFGWESGVDDGSVVDPKKYQKENIKINQLTSFLIRTKSRIHLLKLRRDIDQWSDEPLMAQIPSLLLQEMWEMIGHVEKVLILISFCVLLVGMMSILISLYTSLNERRREMAILRSLGIGARKTFVLLLYESLILVISGVILGVASLYALLLYITPILQRNFSIFIEIRSLNSSELVYLGLVVVFGTIVGLIPGIKAYRNSLQDGLTIKI